MGVIDPRLLRDQPDLVRAAQAKRGLSADVVDVALAADEARRAAIASFEAKRSEQKSLGKQVAAAKGDEKAELLARTKALSGDGSGARADAARGVEMSASDPWVLALAGEAMESVDRALARDYWTRALYRLASRAETRRDAIWLRYRLARLDDREGRAGDALREWRTILAERPDDAEARRRVAELTGESSR